MAGIFLDKHSIKADIQNWMNSVASSDDAWKWNNMHIDEIKGLEEITRGDWMKISFVILNIMAAGLKCIDSLVPFFHIDISYSLHRISVERLSLNWLDENVDEYTPPSLNCTSLEYYNSFYKHELVRCNVDDSILALVDSLDSFDFFYRTYFDETESMFSREVYVFVRDRK